MLQQTLLKQRAKSTRPSLTIGISRSLEEITEYQRLRYQVYSEEFGVTPPSAQHGIDADDLDAYCHHLLVRESETGRVVGGYRLLTGEEANRLGGFYSDREFTISLSQDQRRNVLEIGRACVHPDFRTGSTIAMLWSAIVKYAFEFHCENVIGVASVSLRDGGALASSVNQRAKQMQVQIEDASFTPRNPLPEHYLSSTSDLPRIPPLINSYLRAGAYLFEQPTWDPDFNTADFFMMLPLKGVSDRYARHFVKTEDLQNIKPN